MKGSLRICFIYFALHDQVLGFTGPQVGLHTLHHSSHHRNDANATSQGFSGLSGGFFGLRFVFHSLFLNDYVSGAILLAEKTLLATMDLAQRRLRMH